MTRYIVQKLLWSIPVVALVAVATFMLIHLIPGDPVDVLLGQQRDPQAVIELRQQLGLDQPIHIQFVKWVGKTLKGDLGSSFRSPQTVKEALFQRFPVTLELLVLSLIWSVVLGIPVGFLVGRRPGTWLDGVGTAMASIGIATPPFLLGILLILALAVNLQWLPVSGYVSPTENLWLNLKLMIMPSLTNGLAFFPVIVQQTRSSVLEVYGEQFITTARAKGASEGRVFARHALKIVLLPIVTLIGLRIGIAFGTGVITEVIFAVPGLGRLMADAIFVRDFPIVQGAVMLVALAVVVSNLLIDVVYVYLDPRIKYG